MSLIKNNLPLGWTQSQLGDLLDRLQYGYTAKAETNPTGIRLLRITDLNEDGVDWTTVPSCQISPADFDKYRLKNGDIVFARSGSIEKAWLVNNVPAAVFASYLIRGKAVIDEIGAWLEYFLKSRDYLKQIGAASAGIGMQNVNAKRLARVSLPLPPLNEQKRIVSKLGELLSKVDACEKRLEKVSRLFEQLRRSVLVAAFSGKLTADWREQHADAEDASELLERIRLKRLELATTQRERTQIHHDFADTRPSAVTRQIPNSWAHCRIGMIGAVCNGSTPSRQVSDYWKGEISWVSSGEVRNNIIFTTREQISQKGFEESSVRLLPPGTVLLAMIGEGKTRGQTAILKTEATINQNIAAVILDHELLASEYLWLWFRFQYESTREKGSGSGPQALNCQRVRELPFVLPPLLEQKEIVRRVDAVFNIASAVEEQYLKAQRQLKKMTSSVLDKAFRGELVPQDPADEPASVLIERIRADRLEQSVVDARPQGRKRRSKHADAVPELG